MYLIKTPWWLRALYPTLTWRMPRGEKTIYLTFDDGPHPTATPFVLEELRKAGAKATFFCIGKNVAQYPALYQQILDEGHATGNHTYNHVNGWKVTDEVYKNEIEQAAQLIKSNLFRPPYGRIKRSQIKQLQTPNPKLQTIMWSVSERRFRHQPHRRKLPRLCPLPHQTRLHRIIPRQRKSLAADELCVAEGAGTFWRTGV
jgi:peptidoglycan/xylan/chitin deacetylase (PgdA/CDA1 family)